MSEAKARVAIVGASHVLGNDLKDRLAEAGYPGSRVELLDLDERVGLLTSYGEEARVVVSAAEQTLRGFVAVCFCSDAETTSRLAPVVAAEGTAIDCTGTLGADNGIVLLDADGSPDATGLLATPHGATLMLSQLAAGVGLGDAICTLMLPASDLADAGTEEMAQQAAALLNFGEAPDDVFGRRLAFDVWPDATRPAGAAGRVRDELAQLGVDPPAIHVLRGSVFHGLAASTYFPNRTSDELAAALGEHSRIGAKTNAREPVDSPARVAGRDGLHVGELRDDPRGGAWLWLLLDNHRAVIDVVLKAVAARLGPAAAAGS